MQNEKDMQILLEHLRAIGKAPLKDNGICGNLVERIGRPCALKFILLLREISLFWPKFSGHAGYPILVRIFPLNEER